MKNKRVNYQNRLFFITILFFIVGMINISFALLGFVCFVLPFVLYWVNNDKVWCKYYCPRAGLFSRLISKISLKRPVPKFITNKRVKNGVLIYFGINMFIMIMSTIAAASGKIEPMAHVRFLLFFRMPFNLPQLLMLNLPNLLIHLGYRIYSMMFTSTIIGIVLGIIYMPRTWCAICPIQTLTTKKNV